MEKNNNPHEKQYHRQMISLCDQYPHDEDILIVKAKSLKYLNKSYKHLECLEEILKINPSNIHALCEIANYLK